MLYRFETENLLRVGTRDISQFSSPSDFIEHYNEYVTVSLISSANISIPSTKFRPYLKPYWKRDNLKALHDDMRGQRRIWIENGKSHDRNDNYYRQYKDAKRTFRKQHRCCKRKLVGSKLNEVCEAVEIDINEYFRVLGVL